MSDTFKYQGNELILFQHAQNWKKYFSGKLLRYIKGNVLEVGAGLGASTLLLNKDLHPSWVLLEPDENMSGMLKGKKERGELPGNCRIITGTIDTISTNFDTIMYIDVLEHIEDDFKEIKKVSSLLNKDGHLIVLSPAFNFLYNPFDKAIGHYRRYNKKMLKEFANGSIEIVSINYLDSLGFIAALFNKLLLKQKYPTAAQIKFWDKWLIPASTVTDKIFCHSFGKSIICVWRKKNPEKYLNSFTVL